jgi:hypothetical protein
MILMRRSIHRKPEHCACRCRLRRSKRSTLVVCYLIAKPSLAGDDAFDTCHLAAALVGQLLVEFSVPRIAAFAKGLFTTKSNILNSSQVSYEVLHQPQEEPHTTPPVIAVTSSEDSSIWRATIMLRLPRLFGGAGLLVRRGVAEGAERGRLLTETASPGCRFSYRKSRSSRQAMSIIRTM